MREQPYFIAFLAKFLLFFAESSFFFTLCCAILKNNYDAKRKSSWVGDAGPAADPAGENNLPPGLAF